MLSLPVMILYLIFFTRELQDVVGYPHLGDIKFNVSIPSLGDCNEILSHFF